MIVVIKVLMNKGFFFFYHKGAALRKATAQGSNQKNLLNLKSIFIKLHARKHKQLFSIMVFPTYKSGTGKKKTKLKYSRFQHLHTHMHILRTYLYILLKNHVLQILCPRDSCTNYTEVMRNT